MHRLRTVTAGIAVAAVAVVVASTAPAFADPIGNNGKPIAPQSYDVVGVGANTDDGLFNQLSVDYNKTIPASKHSASHPYFYSWNATLPGSSSTVPTTIVPKAGCKSITRPNGSTAGLNALKISQQIAGGHYCIDFARSSSGRSSSSPPLGPGGVIYVALAEDAVTYATRDTGGTKTVPNTYAPKNLTTAQLKNIFLCNYTNWKQVGGPNQPIKAYLPQTGAGTLSFWLKALGINAAGSCVNESLEENQGQSKQFNSPNAIFIYSVADWIAQKYHSAACGKTPTGTQNKYGCNQTGYLGLNSVKVGSTVYSPITTAKVPTINKAFSATHLTRTIYDILRWTSATPDHILSRLEPFFASAHAKVKGYACANPTAIKDIEDYGFLTVSTCGVGS
ncbi:MAG TPA: substrate-binding domain-containing protein [Streptosporangiaceae bacterium]|jgi:ABC-type phosphate transport system substrate-binding protein|nr:substrate-binding domain-containing protein [Streptosporangiaceae bacterium]